MRSAASTLYRSQEAHWWSLHPRATLTRRFVLPFILCVRVDGQYNLPCICEVGDAGDTDGSTDGKQTCAQVQKHKAIHGGQEWYMPAMSYHVSPLPGVNLEVVALDLNSVDDYRICTWIACNKARCDSRAHQYRSTSDGAPCTMSRCGQVLRKRAEAALRLLKRRVEAAEQSGTQLIILSHYPTNWVSGMRHGGITISSLLTNPNVHIVYFGGHVHSTDNTSNVQRSFRRHGWYDYCVGGGGGWACDGPQGFVVGEVLDTGRITNLRFKMMPNRDCCVNNPRG